MQHNYGIFQTIYSTGTVALTSVYGMVRGVLQPEMADMGRILQQFYSKGFARM